MRALRIMRKRLLLAGPRPSNPAIATPFASLYLRLLSDLQRIVDLDPEIPDRALEFGVAEEELDRSEIFGPPVDQRGFRASHRMRSLGLVLDGQSYRAPKLAPVATKSKVANASKTTHS